jgi:glucose-1-phosphate cytidylyltransferase
VICLGYKGYIIKEYFANYLLHMSDVTLDVQGGNMEIHQNTAEPWRISLIDTGLETMTGGRLKQVAPHLGDETFCLTYGDGLSDLDIDGLIRFHRSHGKLATVTTITPPSRFGHLQLDGIRVTDFSEKLTKGVRPINGGYFVFEPGVLDYIEGDATVLEKEPMDRLVSDAQLMAFQHDGFWQPMDTLREQRLLESLWAGRAPPWRKWES